MINRMQGRTKREHVTRWKIIAIIGGGLLSLSLFLFFNLIFGEAKVTVLQVITSLTQAVLYGDSVKGGAQEHLIVISLRLPRAVMAMLAGAALAVSGALLQTITRNPLASAGTFGINAGAYLMVVFATVFFPSVISGAPLLIALIGGMGGALLAYIIAGGKKGTPVRMALSGMIVTMVLASATSALQLIYENETNGLFVWGSGSLVQNDWKGVQFAWPWITIGLIVMMWLGRQLDLLELGDETASALGEKVSVTRGLALTLAILLASVSVSIVGPIGFVGLIAPHLVKLLGIHRHRYMLLASAIWGAVVLVGADAVAKLVRSSIGELPAGAVTALLGAPWLVWLAVRGSNRQAQGADNITSMQVGRLKINVSYVGLLLILFILLGLALLAGLSMGGVKIPIQDLLLALQFQGQTMYENMIYQSRLPRMLTAALSGVALAVSGVMLQGSVRNPLADPSVIGVTSGAGVGALLLLVVWTSAPASLLPLSAMGGSVVAAGIVYSFAWRKGLHPTTVTLVGIAVTAAFSAVIHFLVIRSQMSATAALAWLAGSTYGRGYSEALLLASGIVVLLPLAWLFGRRMDLLAFGDVTAQGLGLKLRQTRLLAAVVGVVLAALAVSAVGTVGFVGLMAPHATRMIIGQNQKKAVWVAAMLGALLMLFADMIGRTVLAPTEIPVGLVTALIGTPYLLALLYRTIRGEQR